MQVSTSAAGIFKPSPFQQRVAQYQGSQQQLIVSPNVLGSQFRGPPAPLLQANVVGMGKQMQRPGTQGSETRSLLLNKYKTLQDQTGSRTSGKAPMNPVTRSKVFSSNANIHSSLTKANPGMPSASNRYASTDKLLKETPVTAYSSGPKLREPLTAHKVRPGDSLMTPQSAQGGRRQDIRSSVESLSNVRQSFDKLPSARGVSSVTKSQSIQHLGLRSSLRKGDDLPKSGKKLLTIQQSHETFRPPGRNNASQASYTADTAADDMVVTSLARSHSTANKILRRSDRDLSVSGSQIFNTLGAGYNLPTADHKYSLKHGLKFGDFGTKPKANGYMEQVVKRAKSSVDPRKYAGHNDWKKSLKTANGVAIPQAKRITLADEMILSKKKLPAPSYYKNEGLTPKILGFYANSESKCSVIGTTAYEKKFIPGPNVYESRGKSMAEILKEKAKKFMYHHQNDYTKTSCKIKKTNVPAPTSYEVAPAIEKSAQMKASIRNSIPRAKNMNHLSTVLRTKKHVPGVGSYKTHESYKQLATMPTSLKMRRH